MTHRSEDEAAWFKSSYSQDNGTACVEVARLRPTARIAIRDSKSADGPVLTVPAAAFAAFVSTARSA
ncbi:DUF397 domain-containing protein [Streptomyces sp. B6B3]|uniref:DUF397 domain-containing protein n=1 Tax=Streptomyces sp. B6B3 TaxID=3153570 RepID=UPI00325F0E2E